MNPRDYISIVTAKRAIGASWGAISGMTGVSVPDLRKAFDPSWPKEFDAPRPPERPKPQVEPEKPARVPKTTMRLNGLGGRILLAINAGHVTTSDIVKVIGHDHAIVAVRLTQLKRDGLVSATGEHRRYVWALTDTSDALLSGLPAPSEAA